MNSFTIKRRSHFFMKSAFFFIALAMSFASFGQNGLDFDGVDDHVMTTYAGITGNQSRTIEAWIRPYYKSTQSVIVDMGANATGQRFTLNILGGKLRIEVQGSGYTGTTNIMDSTWHHVAVTYDNSLATNKYSMYVDGNLEGTFDISTPVNTALNGPVRIGIRTDAGADKFYLGQMDEVRIWNRARSLSEIVADTGIEYCEAQSGLVAYHRFNQAIAGGLNTNDSVSIDDSGLGHNGALHNFALNGTSSNWVLGKLTPCTPPTCLAPSGLQAFDVYGATAKITWNQNNIGSTVKVEYGVAGYTYGTGTKLIPTNDTILLTGLSPLTSYDIYVRDICSSTDSSSLIKASFTTGCNVISTYPYLETFDGSTWISGSSTYNAGSAIDQCWSVTPTTGTNLYVWSTRAGTTTTTNSGPTTDISGTGNYIYTESNYGTPGLVSNFISPYFDLTSLTAPQLSFQYHMYGTSMGTLMALAWNGTSYDTLMNLSGNQGNVWNEAILDLSPYANSTTHIVFHAVRGSSIYSDMAIDQVSISEAPPCPKVTFVTASNITSNSFDINFNSSGTSFEVEFGPSGFMQGTGSTTNLTASGQTVTGLLPSTSYDFYIRNNCTGSGNGTSIWQGPYTLQTLCSYTNTYFTNWDNLTSLQSDYCWTYLTYGSTSSSVYAYAYQPSSGATLQPFTSNNYYRLSNGPGSKCFFISPEITQLDQNNLQLRFQGADNYTSIYIPQFIIGTMSSTTDSSSFVPVDTITTVTNAWTEYTVPLTNVPANHKYVVIRIADNGSYLYMGLDDLHIEPVPSCTPPSAASAAYTTDSSTVLSWTSGDASIFEIEYGVTGFMQGFGTVKTGLTNLDTITGLSENTCYDFYIRGNCSSNNSPWYGPFSTCTECSVEYAPYLEDFEDASWNTASNLNNAINECWKRTPSAYGSIRWESGTGTTTTINTGPSTDVSGSGKYAFLESTYGNNGASAFLTTPKVNFASLTAPTLSFYYHMYGSTIGTLHVRISNGTSYDTLFTLSGQQQLSMNDPWEKVYIDLTAYKNDHHVIEFIAVRSTSSTGDIAIDEVSIDEAPSCVAPNNFALDSVYTNFANLSWTSITNGTNFKIEYGPQGFTPSTNPSGVLHVSSSPTQLTGLLSNNSYDVYIADLCDSTTWVGPLSFTTLISDDARLVSLISPSNLSCGDSNLVFEVAVKNNGLNPISNLPINIDITGDINTTINTVYSSTLLPDSIAIVQVGTVNTYQGGTINVIAYVSMNGDVVPVNDSVVFNNMNLISVLPAVYPYDSLCTQETSGEFAAIAQNGITYNWYQNVNDVVPFATTDTVAVLPNQTLYLDRSKSADQLILDAIGTSQFGNMFKLYIKQNMAFTGFSFKPAASGTSEPIAFYKSGNFIGSEMNRGDWTAIDSLVMPGLGMNTWYRFNFTNPVQFVAGDTISIYIANKQSSKLRWSDLTSSVSNVGDLYISNDDFEYYAGVTGAYFGANMVGGTTPRAVSSYLHYNTNNVCSNTRIAITMGVRTDTAVAAFNHLVNANGADVDFDASASIGDVFQWNYGDGNTGSGITSTHTYAVAGTYAVSLFVTDTACGTTDTLQQNVLATVSSDEFALNNGVLVYPNPNRGSFKLGLDFQGEHHVEVKLLNALGQVVYAADLGLVDQQTEAEINLSNLPAGIYNLCVMTDGKSITEKVTIL